MIEIREDLLKVFQNDKIVDIFANSDTQGLIVINLERKLTFHEILELEDRIFNSGIIKMTEKYQSYPNIIRFLLVVQDKVSELSHFYREKGTADYAIEFVKLNPRAVKNKFPRSTKLESYEHFIQQYLLKHKEIESNSYEQVKDFFDNPLNWL